MLTRLSCLLLPIAAGNLFAEETGHTSKPKLKASALAGYWQPNEEDLFKVTKRSSKTSLELGEVTERELRDYAKQRAEQTVMIIAADGTVTTHDDVRTKKRKLEIGGARNEAGEAEVTLISASGRREPAYLSIKGDLLTMRPRRDGAPSDLKQSFRRLSREAGKKLAREILELQP